METEVATPARPRRKLERIKAGSSSAFNERLTYRLFSQVGNAGSPFYSSLVAVTAQTWGGKTDAILERLVKCIMQCKQDYDSIRDKYIKSLGTPVRGGWSLDDISTEDMRDFDEAMEELAQAEILLPEGIQIPIQLVKRKKTAITPVQAAVLSDLFTVKWNESDDGKELDE